MNDAVLVCHQETEALLQHYDDVFRGKAASMGCNFLTSVSLDTIDSLVLGCRQNLTNNEIDRGQNLTHPCHRPATAVQLFHQELPRGPIKFAKLAGYQEILSSLFVASTTDDNGQLLIGPLLGRTQYSLYSVGKQSPV